MRRTTLDLLRCPRCLAGSLVPDAPVAAPALIYGPVRCLGCHARFPVDEGLIDFVGERAKPSPLQQALELPWVARSWERYVRPAVDAVLTRSRLDRDSEYVVTRNMLGRPTGPVVDLGCGSGAFLQRLARDFSAVNAVGLDVSRPMIEEAMAHARENALSADFVRAEVPPLPFLDGSIGGIVATSLVHFVEDLDVLLAEAARVLKPGAHLVASSYEASMGSGPIQRTAGLHPRSEQELRASAEKTGLIRFERVKVGAFLVWKCERP